MLFCLRLTFFKINIFKKNLSRTISECQTVWIHIRTEILPVLIWVQAVCKGYQQTTNAALYVLIFNSLALFEVAGIFFSILRRGP